MANADGEAPAKEAAFVKLIQGMKEGDQLKVNRIVESFRGDVLTQPDQNEFENGTQHDVNDFIRYILQYYTPRCDVYDATVMKRAGLEHRGEEAPMPMMMSLLRAAATAGCKYCPNGIMEMSTLGTTTLLVDLAQLVEQGSVKEFEKTGRDVVEKGTVALSESLIVASSNTLETYRTNTRLAQCFRISIRCNAGNLEGEWRGH